MWLLFYMLYKSKILTLETMAYSWYVDEYISMGPRGRFHSHKCYIGLFETGLYMGRAPRTKETLPDFCERGRVIRHPRVFPRVDG